MTRPIGLLPIALFVLLTACSKEGADDDVKTASSAATATAAAERDAVGAGTVKVGDRTVEAGGVKVKTGDDGAEVQAGGTKVKTAGDSAEVEAGGVKVGKDGKVKVPGVLP